VIRLKKYDKKSSANAKGKARQWCMFEGQVQTKSELTDPSNDVSFTLAVGCQMVRSVLCIRIG